MVQRHPEGWRKQQAKPTLAHVSRQRVAPRRAASSMGAKASCMSKGTVLWQLSTPHRGAHRLQRPSYVWWWLAPHFAACPSPPPSNSPAIRI